MINIVGENAEKLQRSHNFGDWLANFDKRFVKINKIEEGWSLWKGKKKDELVFALLFVHWTDENGEEKGTVVFYRSNSTGIFLVFEDKTTEKKYVVLVEQVRLPSGGKLLEITAGSVEENNDFFETIVREVAEEVGFTITGKNLGRIIPLGEYFLSPGACNEKMALYACEIELPYQDIMKLKDKMTGTPGENTKVRVFPLETFETLGICDAKTILAYELYKKKAVA